MTKSTLPSTPKPVSRPTPKPHSAGAAKPVPSRSDSAAVEATAQGRVDDEGNVWLRSGDGERIVGQYAAEGSKEGVLAIYARRYLDLEAQLASTKVRVEIVNLEESAPALRAFDGQIVEPSATGDIEGPRDRSAALASRISELRAEHKAKYEQAKAEARAQREALTKRAEAIMASVNTPVNWRDTWAELMELLGCWKDAQKNDPRVSRSTNDTLWKCLSHARKMFEDARRAFFARLRKERAHAVAAKEQLISEAEAIIKSTDWRETSNEMRCLTDEWKTAGRVSKHDDDVLWERFMAACEVSLSVRSAHHAAVDQEFANNLVTKPELLAEAEALLPIDDLDVARAACRDVGERWEAIDTVPRSDYPRAEGRTRQIVDEIRRAEDEQWWRTDPEKKQRSTGMTAQFEVLTTELDGEIVAAKGTEDEAKVKELNEVRQVRQAWLDRVNSDL